MRPVGKPLLDAVIRLVGPDLSSDETLAAQLLGKCRNRANAAESVFSLYVSGSWIGKASERWQSIADSLEAAANRTGLPKVSRWTRGASQTFQRMAENDRRREQEERLRYR